MIKHHLEEFIRQFKHALVSRQIWDWLDITPPETLTDIQRAARFFYLQKLGFGGKVDGRTTVLSLLQKAHEDKEYSGHCKPGRINYSLQENRSSIY